MFAFSSILWLEYASCYLLPISFQKQFRLHLSKLHTATFHNFHFLCCLSFACFSVQFFFKQTVSPVILLRASRTLFSLNNIPSSFLGDTPIFLGAECFNEACLFFAEANANNFWTFGNKHTFFCTEMDPGMIFGASLCLNSSMFVVYFHADSQINVHAIFSLGYIILI